MQAFRFASRLYPIADTLGDPRLSYSALSVAIARAGAPLLQLRAKHLATAQLVAVARELRAITARYSMLLIINDRADIAKLVDADGVHLGQDDLPAPCAREILGPDKIIGVSTHNVAQAEAAARAGVADYIGFGPLFPTTSKERPDPVQGLAGLRMLRHRVALPIVAIGGITAGTMHAVLEAGADAVAMIGEIVRADDVETKVASLLR